MNLPTASNLPLNAAAPQEGAFAICLEDVTVRYRVPSERISTFKEFAIRWLQRRVTQRDFSALQQVFLDVRPGEVFGVIGNNGAGKSTLLKVIAQVIFPNSGRVRVRGRVAPLLELGAGFHQELTGRENIFLNGAILGFSRREIQEDFNQIVEFAELDEFIDAPMRTYSSGMWARLGFAVATDVRPDILLVDEVLSVGDENFQQKCSRRIQDFRNAGTTIVLVSHNMDMIQSMCQRAAWLNHGRVMILDAPEKTVQEYRAHQTRLPT